MSRFSRRRSSPRSIRSGGGRGGWEPLERRCLLAVDVGNYVGGPMLWDESALVGDAPAKGDRPYVADQVVVAVNGGWSARDFREGLAEFAWPEEVAEVGFGGANFILESTKDAQRPVTLVQLRLAAGSDVPALAEALEQLPQVAWAEPNYLYDGPDPREFTPNDPQYGSQYHHPLMDNNLSWDVTLGSPSVIIGITDDGVSYTHTDLSPNIWANDDPLDGVDNDGNGFTDDLRGWDFIDGDNNPTHDGGDNHGSHVAGIAAARTNNSLGVAGTAGGSTIMPLRFYGSSEGWNAAEIAATYSYAADNGAKIVSTSYNVDSWVGNATFTAGLQYLYDEGVLHFNSAGNNGSLNPPRQAFHQSLFVASTTSSDTLSSFSNYGTGIDLAAPGSGILSTIPTNTYAVFDGTSMATPNAAGVAALVWSANPSYTRDQVAAAIAGGAENIDAQNPTRIGLLGHGRVNSYQALLETPDPPQIDGVAQLPPEGGNVTAPITTLTVELGSIFAGTTIHNPANWELRGDGDDDVFGTADDVLVPLTLTTPNYMVGTNDLTFTVGSMAADRYRFSAKAALTDPFGQALDGDSDGVGGDDYVRNFTFERQLTIGVAPPLGGLVYAGSVSETSGAAAVPFAYKSPLTAGQTIGAVATSIGGSPLLTLALKLGSTTVATATSPAPGQPAVLTGFTVPQSGNYSFVLTSTTNNGFSINAYVGAGFEAEMHAGPANNSTAAAQNIESTAVALTPNSERLAVVGRTDSAANPDFYRFDLGDGEALSLGLSRVGTGSIALEIHNSSGATVATGSTGFTNVTLSVQDFIAPAAGTYYARVSGTANQNYALVATRGASFGLETSSPSYAQPIGTTKTLLGHNGVPPIASETEPNDNGVTGATLADLALANDLSGSFAFSGGAYVATVTGAISAGNDVDWDFFRFYAKPGDSLLIDLDGVSLSDSYLRLYSNNATQLAFDDDSGPSTDAQISFNGFTYEGDYYIVADSFSTGTGTYALTARLTSDSVTLGSDSDQFSFALSAGQSITWTTTTPDYGYFSDLDPQLALFDPSSAQVAFDDNSAPDGRNAVLSYTAAAAGTYTLRLSGASGVGNFVVSAAIDAVAPSIGQVSLGSTLSTHAPYEVPVGSGEQLRTAPVAKINLISIAFNEPVNADLRDLTVTGVSVANYPLLSFSYDAVNYVGTWRLTTPVEADRITLTLADTVTDSSGNPLDGEWENPTSLADPSSGVVAGDGLAGGDFVFLFTSLPGDANRDNLVDGADFTLWNDHFDGESGPGGKLFTQGDFSGDGFVSGADMTIWADNFGTVFSSPVAIEGGARQAAEAARLAPSTSSRRPIEPISAPASRIAPEPPAKLRAARSVRAVDAALALVQDFRREI